VHLSGLGKVLTTLHYKNQNMDDTLHRAWDEVGRACGVG
jgi:hypothetical protein